MVRLSGLVPLAAFVMLCGRAGAEQLPPAAVYGLLMKVARAPTVVSYHGTVMNSFSDDGRERTVELTVSHAPGQQDAVSVVNPPNAPPRAPEDAHRPRPMNPLVFFGPPGVRERLENDLALLLRNYTFSAESGENIAGRSTYRIEIDPKYPGRKEKILWVDDKTGVVLKSTVVRAGNQSNMTSYFTSIEESPNEWSLARDAQTAPPAQFPQPLEERNTVGQALPWVGAIDNDELAGLRRLSEKEQFSLLAPSFVPDGFVIEDVRELPNLNAAESSVVHILYSDGLSSISLFLQREEPLWPNRIRRFFFGVGPHGAFFRHNHPPGGITVLEGNRDGTRFVLVSDISNSEIKHMADSLSPVNRAEQ